MENTENNKLIVEFMGAELDVSCAHYDECEVDPTLIKNVNPLWRRYDEMEYHSSWDWLMPVVEKIKKNVEPKQWEYLMSVLRLMDIIKMHEAVVDFIKWYNENKQKL